MAPPVLTADMETPDREDADAAAPEQAVSSPPRADSHSVVEAYTYLLDGAPPIDETPKALHARVSDLLDLLTGAHAMEILYHLFCEERPLRFTELEDATGASPKVLSRRLRELTEAGLISRQSYDEMPPHVEYEPTATAQELDPAFQFLYAWATRHDVEHRTDG